MILFREAVSLVNFIDTQKQQNKTIGFVPTMGALHEGHVSLIELAREHAEIVVVSIFVNPTQFNDPKDFEKYPVTLSDDIFKLESSGCDVLFLPSVNEIYPDGFQSPVRYDLGKLEVILEGAHRPGHFQGVCQVVHRLLDIVKPHQLFLGQKDYQQCMVIRQLVESFKMPIEIIIGETLREQSGLAMSSRNMRLSEEEKKKAVAIYQALKNIQNNYTSTPFDKLIAYSENFLLHEGFSKVDYVAIVHAHTLEPVLEWDGSTPLVALVAAFLNDVRLIDNMLLHPHHNLTG